METKSQIKVQCYHSPCGDLMLGSFGDKLCLCNWVEEKKRGRVENRLCRLLKARYEEGTSDVIREAERQLDEYFKRERRTFNLPLLFAGTDFQQRVWQKLLEVPYGHTLSYGAMAGELGMPKAVRAVANANGANALSVIVPCHRIVGDDRSLTGYAGGLEAKRFLLDLERDECGV